MSDSDSGSDSDMESRSLSPPTPPISDIAPDGDVVLIVGEEKARLRVHSQFLRAASKVFNAMFSPRWSEGQALSSQNPPEIPLEEDDADALRTIFCVLHHRISDVPETLTTAEIANIAVMSDKYDLTLALKYISTHWLEKTSGDDLTTRAELMAAAYLFNNNDRFAHHTLQLILHTEPDQSFSLLHNHRIISELLPPKTVGLLEERRSRMRGELCHDIAIGSGVTICDCKTGSDREALELLKQRMSSLLREGGIFTDFSVQQIIDEIENTYEGAHFVKCSLRGNLVHSRVDVHEVLTDYVLEDLMSRMAIRIDCVRDKKCRFKHARQ